MTETVRLNRLVQFAYPALIFFAVLLTWSTASQVTGFADPRIPLFNVEPLGDTPATALLSCSGNSASNKDDLFSNNESMDCKEHSELLRFSE